MALASLQRTVVASMVMADKALDELVYRPAVVKLFAWLPRWWLCDLAQASMALDDRWKLGYWAAAGIVPHGVCEACGRRAAIHVVGGSDPDCDAEAVPGERVWVLDNRPVYLCGWCSISTPVEDQTDLNAALAEARARSIAWRWRW